MENNMWNSQRVIDYIETDLGKTVETCFILDLSDMNITSIEIPPTLTELAILNIRDNRLTSIIIPPTLIKLQSIDLAGNDLSEIVLPPTLTQLKIVDLALNPNLIPENCYFPLELVKLISLAWKNNKSGIPSMFGRDAREWIVSNVENQVGNYTKAVEC